MRLLTDIKVLCVEDDDASREELVHFLKKRVAKVFEACDGIEGIEQYHIHKPDIILADILMPGLDGLEMLRKIKAEDEEATAIVATSVNSVDSVIAALDIGVDSYIMKPIDFGELEIKLMKAAAVVSRRKIREKGRFDLINDKAEVEDEIKKGFIKLVKSITGKGPREAVVHIMGDAVSVISLGGYTGLEESFIAKHNQDIVRHIRHEVFFSYEKEFNELIENITGIEVRTERVDSDVRKGIDKIVYKLK